MSDELITRVELADASHRSANSLPGEGGGVFVIWFDDIRGSTAMKEAIANSVDEEAFHRIRRAHDELITEIIHRDGGGQVLKSTGDGILAIFWRPSVAIERSAEIQERLHGHPQLSVRIGMDMGEVRFESDGVRITDVFGKHVDYAARATSMADAGHICCTRAVFTDAFSWITKTRLAWKDHGWYRVKEGEPPLEMFEPFNANVTPAMTSLNGEQVSARPDESGAGATKPRTQDSPLGPATGGGHLISPWEAVARDGRALAERGAGMMYWFKVPLGGICYPEGFRSFLQPALENQRIRKIRFILDTADPATRQAWDEMVLPLIQGWAAAAGSASELRKHPDGGEVVVGTEPATTVSWIFDDLTREVTPTFKFLVADPDAEVSSPQQAQIFLTTATRRVRFGDGTQHAIRVPDTILRIHEEDDRALLMALNTVANQWDTLF